MAQTQNLVVDQGSTVEIQLTVTNADGSIMNLTDYSARAQMRKSYGSATKFDITATVETPKTAGVVKLALTPTQSRALKAGRYVYDAEVYTAADADVLRIVEGIVSVMPGTYRAPVV